MFFAYLGQFFGGKNLSVVQRIHYPGLTIREAVATPPLATQQEKKMPLDNISIRRAPLSDKIVLARFGKDPKTALETRDVQDEFWQALVAYAFDGKMPSKGQACEIKFGGGDEQFVLTIKREQTQT